MLYRILDNLEWGNGHKLAVGSIDALKGVSSKVRAHLEARGVISKVVAPPVRILPGWEDRAGKLERVGVEDVNDLLEADPSVLSEKLDTPLEEVEDYVEEARRFIEPEQEV